MREENWRILSNLRGLVGKSDVGGRDQFSISRFGRQKMHRRIKGTGKEKKMRKGGWLRVRSPSRNRKRIERKEHEGNMGLVKIERSRAGKFHGGKFKS